MAKKTIHDLGQLQRAVMEIIWELGEAKVGDVRDRLNAKRKKTLAYTTVLSAMQKLEKSGWLKHRMDGRANAYRAVRSREEAGTSSIRNLVNKVFAGDPLVMFQHLLSDERLDEKDLASLRKMIDQRRKELKDD